jgi:oligoendopeptidase F
MFDTLPSIDEFMTWDWEQIQPLADDLLTRELTEETIDKWLRDMTLISDYLQERGSRLRVARLQDTTDEEAEAAYKAFMTAIYPKMMTVGNQLNRRLLASGITPAAIAVPLRITQADVDIFSEDNIPLKVEENDLSIIYDKIIAAQSVEWEGEEVTLTQLSALAINLPREERERAWRLASDRVLEDRDTINENWTKLFDLRQKIAANAGFDTYRQYAWKQRGRFDYTPEDALQFAASIEEVVVPAAERMYTRFAEQLGVETLRPWDLNVNPLRTTDLDLDPFGRNPLKPFDTMEELVTTSSTIFHAVDPSLGSYFDRMVVAEQMDLPNRKGKGPGAFCTYWPVTGMPFVFHNAVPKHNDVQTMLHEFGHAFHAFEAGKLDYALQRSTPMEFNEVASMAMELLAAPYLNADRGGFYETQAAARARAEHLYSILMFWPYMAVVDSFQHWAYTHGDQARDPAACDAKWAELWGRFMKGIDFSGLEADMMTGWHRKLHIHRYPFYYIEYGLAQLGAVQVWGNALEDQSAAVQSYREALALGGTVTLPELYTTAGATLGFDVDTLSDAVTLVEGTLEKLEASAG